MSHGYDIDSVVLLSDEAMLTEPVAACHALLDEGSYDATILSATLPVISKTNPLLVVSGTCYVEELGGRPAICGGWTREYPGGVDIVEGGHQIDLDSRDVPQRFAASASMLSDPS